MGRHADGIPAELAELAPLLHGLECGAVVADRAGNVRWVNARLCRMLGYSNPERLAGSLSFRPFGEHTGRTCAAMWRAVLTGRIWSGKANGRARNGDRLPVTITVAPLPDALARTYLLLALHTAPDTSRERRRARKTAERAMEAWHGKPRIQKPEVVKKPEAAASNEFNLKVARKRATFPDHHDGPPS